MLSSKDNFQKFISWLSFACLFLLFVPGLWPQISMFLFGGKVVFPNVFFKFILILIVFVSFLIRKKLIQELIPTYILLLIYLFGEFLYFSFYLKYDFNFILFGYNIYYFFIFLFPFFISVRYINEKNIIMIFLITSVPIYVLALLQHFLNSNIIPVRSIDGYYDALVWSFYGKIRAYSFFGVSLLLAIFSTLVSLLCFKFYLTQKDSIKKILFLVMFLISIFVVYITYSRTGYLIFIGSFISFILFEKSNNYKFLNYLPVFYFLIGLVLVLSLYFLNYHKLNEQQSILYKQKMEENLGVTGMKFKKYYSSSTISYAELIDKTPISLQKGSAPVLASDSFVMRVISWKIAIDLIFNSWKSFLFGQGIYYSRHINMAEYACDNLYIDILLHTGIIGLILFFAFLWQTYKYLIKLYDNSLFRSVIISFFSTLPLSNFTSNIIFVYLNIVLFLFLSDNNME